MTRLASVASGGRLAALVAACLLAACASMDGIGPQAQLHAPVVPDVAADVAPLQPQWWREFGDARLDALVAQALQGNPNLGVAQARLRRALAISQAANAATLPQLSGALDLTRQRYTENGAVPPPLAGSVRETGTLQLSTSWEIDFFGRNRAAIEAAVG
ncbi:MAG: efflux system, outer rane lipoprotein NodT, partial [Ramlibacter sp.]|uniref:TolC family protein n=1 Tax=Ramlibacter sp. TaxID=1917967 RepID=UPI002638BDE5